MAIKYKSPINELSKEAQASMLKRVLIGLLMTAVVVPCLFLGGWFYFILILFVIGASTYEMVKAPCHRISYFVYIVTFIVMYALVFWAMLKANIPTHFKDFSIYTSFKSIWLSPIALGVMIILYAFVVVIKEDFYINDAFYLIAMTLLLSIAFQSILYLRYIPFTLFSGKEYVGMDLYAPKFKYFQSSFLIYYLLIAVLFNDMFAYFIGVLFGRHKINPRISPKKTWEGFFGGIIGSALCSAAFGLLVAKFNMPMLPSFTINNWYWIVICSIALPLLGNLGDFTFSAIKRHFAIKDYSHVLGPHGGVLDRIDSTIVGAIGLTILVTFISNGWNFYIN